MPAEALKQSIERALQAARETRCVEMGEGVLSRTPEIFAQQFGDKPMLLVADRNTFAAAGQTVLEAFRRQSRACREPFVFTDPKLYAEHKFVVSLEAALRPSDAIPLAVGSGTINDLTKLAAQRTGRPYLAVATAASMDGYTAFGASITHNGSKQTFTCPAPRAVVADLSVIRAAPAEMNASGYADLVAKTTAGADWLLADALGVEPLVPRAWEIVQDGLREALANPDGVRTGDLEAISQLTAGLMLGGFAMQWAQSSRPASGAEHQFSHLWDMEHHIHGGQAPSHGFKVGIGTLAMTALYEELLSQPLEALDTNRCSQQWPDENSRESTIKALFQEADLRAVALQESRAKSIDPGALSQQLEKLRLVWPELRPRLHAQLLPFAEVKRMLRTARAPVEPEQIGISRQRLRESFQRAYFIRRRFTILDVAVRAGLLENCLGRIFGEDGPWSCSKSEDAEVGAESPH